MNSSVLPYLSWTALAAMILLWVGVGFFVKAISEEETAYASHVSDVEQESVRQAAQLRLHALARETKGARAKLEDIAHGDIVEILEMVESISRDVGIPIKIGQALSASAPSGTSVRAATFVVEAEGTFAQIMHTVALLEFLPVPSSVDELHFEQLPPGSGKSKTSIWRLVVHMHFLTTAEIPS